VSPQFLTQGGGQLHRLDEHCLPLPAAPKRAEKRTKNLHRVNKVKRKKVEKRSKTYLTNLNGWRLFQVRHPLKVSTFSSRIFPSCVS
jgi:hypothetical protein